jgi:hypothetical protein
MDLREHIAGKFGYRFSGKLWTSPSPNAWHFISLPTELANEIRRHLKSEEQGWGRLQIFARIGETQWATAIWFDTKLDTYLLPIKSEIRKRENLYIEMNIDVSIWI